MGAAADVGVVGAGIVGLATAFALAERGASVAVYERGVPGDGMSGGEARIFRHAHDDPRLVALARDARAAWREWEAGFGAELVSGDGTVAIGPAGEARLGAMREAGVRVRTIGPEELAQRLGLLAPWDGEAVLEEDGGVIRTHGAVAALVAALRGSLVADEVVSVRATASGTAEVRAGGVTAEHGAVVVCAGRGTPALARGAGVSVPLRQAVHVRLAYPVRGEVPARLACLQDSSGAFGATGAYGDPLPGNRRYAVGLVDAPAREDGSLHDAADLATAASRTTGYVAQALPGLEPEPAESRHCWVTELPWSHDGLAAWETDGITFVAGHNLFKHAPVLGRALARAALGEGLAPQLRPESRLGEPAGSGPGPEG